MRRKVPVRALVLIAAILSPVMSAQTLNLKVSFDEPQRPAPGGQKPVRRRRLCRHG